MLSYADPPLILRDVFPNIQQVQDLLTTHAPYTPLGGWYNPGADPHAKTRPMWFQNDWVHDTHIAEGSEIFLNNDTYIEQSKACLLYTSPSPRDGLLSRMPSSA